MGLLVVAVGLLGVGHAQTNPVPSSVHSHRYLLIFETSRSMHRRSEGVLESVQALLASKMGGQLANGDTIGLWTYNEELSAGKLPIQQWSEDTQQAITARIIAFVKAQKYEKQGRIDTVLPPLGHLIKNSRVITVFLISDGTEEIHGTTFDDKINNVFKLWRGQQQDSHMPFITVLRGVRGNLTDCAANPAPWTVELPPLPPEPQVAKAAPKAPAATPKRAPTLPPLIISGKQHQPSAAATSAPASSATTAFAASASTNDAAPRSAASLVPPSPSPSSAPQTSPVSQQQIVTTSASVTTAASPAVSNSAQPPPVAATSALPQTSNEPPRPRTAGNESLNLSSGARMSDLAAKSSQAHLSPSTDQQSKVPSTATTNAMPTQVATVASRGAISTSTLLALAALFGIVLMLGLIWFWRSRPRPTQPESLITQSFDRNRK